MEFKETWMLLLNLDSHIQVTTGGYGYPPRAVP
jgi:hypothetical protein